MQSLWEKISYVRGIKNKIFPNLLEQKFQVLPQPCLAPFACGIGNWSMLVIYELGFYVQLRVLFQTRIHVKQSHHQIFHRKYPVLL